MRLRVKVLIGLMIVGAAGSLKLVSGPPSHDWVRFAVYFVVVVLSAGLKVAMPKGEGTMSVNFPFILLGILQLSPWQAVALAAVSVIAQCRIRVTKAFTLVQIAFNLGNVIVATALAYLVFEFCTRHGFEMAPSLALAATVYFFLNTIPVALVIGWTNSENVWNLWRRQFPWYLPFYLVGAFLAAIVQLISIHLGWVTSLLIVPTVYTIYRAYRAQISSIEARQRHLEETKALHLRTIEGLAMAIEAKDHGTHDHLLRVRVYVSEIGRIMRLDELQTQALLTAAFLHDIGKLAVPEYIINKPGRLTPEEFEKMKIHPVVGADILERVRFPYPVTPIVRSHHEAWDGSGYPDGLKGEEIPIGARILTIVDCFDALASDRPYRRALPLEEAMAYVKSKAGSQFDPGVVSILEAHYVELETLARQDNQSLAPLETDILIARGAAPAAGFERINASNSSAGELSPAIAGDAGVQSVSDQPSFQDEALPLISGAGREEQAILAIGRALGNSMHSHETASVVSSSLRTWIPFDCLAVYLTREDYLHPYHIDGSGVRSFSSIPIAAGQGVSGWVLETGKPIVNGNPEVEPNYLGERGSLGQMRSALSVPLVESGDKTLGVLTLYSTHQDSFSMEHLRILQAVGSKLSLQNALNFEDVGTDARVDFVTQLPNIRQFSARLEAGLNEALQSGQSLGVVVCDLISFKAVDDRLGHAMGNKLLKTIADGFQETCRKEDMVARMGRDEFVFLMPGVDSRSLEIRLGLLEQTVREACASLQADIDVWTSVGAAFCPDDCRTADELLDLADRRRIADRDCLSFLSGVGVETQFSKLPEAS